MANPMTEHERPCGECSEPVFPSEAHFTHDVLGKAMTVHPRCCAECVANDIDVLTEYYENSDPNEVTFYDRAHPQIVWNDSEPSGIHSGDK